MRKFDKTRLNPLPLEVRENKNVIPDGFEEFTEFYYMELEKIACEIIKARRNNRPVIVAFGAHLIKNGLGIVLKRLVEKGYITHLATNGAGSIHDWEFAFQGQTGEDVRKYVAEGQFGLWEETGRYINAALIQGAKDGLGYGESIGKMIHTDSVGDLKVRHCFKNFSIQEAAYANKIPFTVHPGFGYDIIYTHPTMDGASIGKCSAVDFYKFVNSVYNLEGGVYISIGSAIMSPMIFEKALSMARNVARQDGQKIDDFMIVVNDIQKGKWNFGKGVEPPMNNPAYYLRFCKSFDRMNSREMHYIRADNRDFLLSLEYHLK